ncbi:UNVERIFIED_CONTAM: hypothetical protein FKN15_000236 [Acipenser sinensis]
MGKKQRQKQHGAGRKPHCISAPVDICLTCLCLWCFLCGEVGHVSSDQTPLWQEVEPEQQQHEESSWGAFLSTVEVTYWCYICGERGHFPLNCPLPPEGEALPLSRAQGEDPLLPSPPEGPLLPCPASPGDASSPLPGDATPAPLRDAMAASLGGVSPASPGVAASPASPRVAACPASPGVAACPASPRVAACPDSPGCCLHITVQGCLHDTV